ncbi:MAG: amidohydrolase [Vicinamibacterales bacterium]
MLHRLALFGLALAASGAGVPPIPSEPPADFAIVNGRVYTADGRGTVAEALAVRGNRIAAVGTAAEIRALTGERTIVVDARGGSVLPGFHDAHIHFLSGGLSLDEANLLDALTLEQVVRTISDFAATRRERPWVVGRGWFYAVFPGNLPTRQQLDDAVPDRPAYMECYDGHTGWANTRALKLAGITRETPDPKNGEIVRDATGEPTGVLKEAATELVTRLLPKPSREDRLRALHAAMREANRFGITSVQNATGAADEFELYDALRRSGEMTVRVSSALTIEPGFSEADRARFDAVRRRYPDDPWFRAGAVKLFADGVIEAFTAAMLEPYATRATTGLPNYTPDELDRIVGTMDREAWQIFIHAIGDRGVRMALDALERAASRNPAPARGRRHRVEHIETIDPIDVSRFGALGVIASMQPYHGTPTPNQASVWSGNIGPARASRAWAYGSIDKAGGRLAFGSDWPVVSLDPRIGMHVATTRTTLDGKPEGGWLPGERLPLARVIDAYTRDGAWATFSEHRTGSLTPGLLADLVLMEENLFATPPGRLPKVPVRMTVVDGRIVYQSQ